MLDEKSLTNTTKLPKSDSLIEDTMGIIASFNKLPPRPEYISLVTNRLSKQDLSLTELIAKTNLTKTQVACTLDMLIAEKKVGITKIKNKKYYRIINEL